MLSRVRSETMRLCFIGTATSPHVLRWVKYFVERKHEVSLISLDSVNKVPVSGLKVFSIKSHDFMNPKNIFKIVTLFKTLNKMIAGINPDLIHVHQISSLAYIIPYLRVHPYILSAWGSDVLIKPYKSTVHSFLASRAIKKADLLHCDGIKTFRALENLGAPPDRIVCVYFGIDIDKFSPEKRDTKYRQALGVDNGLTVISTRALSPIYNVETLINAIPRVVREINNAKFLICGSGSLKEKLEDLAKKLKISDHTIFTGNIPVEELPFYVASSDIYVSTSLSDAGLASSTGEAMACGLPVIVTEDLDNRDWIKDGVNGFIVPVKNPDALAERIIELARNEKLRGEFGRENRKIITERNDYNTEMRKMEKEYMRLVSMEASS